MVATDFDQSERALEVEWYEQMPEHAGLAQPEDIERFYQTSKTLGPQLDAWHDTEARQSWTQMVVNVARRSGVDSMAETAIDIGCGTGHEVRALRDAGVRSVFGVEPNDKQRIDMLAGGLTEIYSTIEDLPPFTIEQADLIVCLDVLEHVPDPDAFLESWCKRARIGATLIERTMVWDTTTPLHRNQGWHPGRMLDAWGWRKIEQERGTGIGIWKRERTRAPQYAQIVQCIYGSPSPPNYRGMLEAVARGYRLPINVMGEGLLPRARSMSFTYFWRECSSDVMVNIDGDVGFSVEDVERLVYWCRNGYDVVCAALPFHDGSGFGIQVNEDNGKTIQFGNDLEPLEIRSLAPGFLAVHRRVLDQVVPTLPLLHASQPYSFYPFCMETVETIEQTSQHTGKSLMPIHAMLSEDWAFSQRLRELGIKQYVARDLLLEHESKIPITIRNMHLVAEAIKRA